MAASLVSKSEGFFGAAVDEWVRGRSGHFRWFHYETAGSNERVFGEILMIYRCGILFLPRTAGFSSPVFLFSFGSTPTSLFARGASGCCEQSVFISSHVASLPSSCLLGTRKRRRKYLWLSLISRVEYNYGFSLLVIESTPPFTRNVGFLLLSFFSSLVNVFWTDGEDPWHFQILQEFRNVCLHSFLLLLCIYLAFHPTLAKLFPSSQAENEDGWKGEQDGVVGKAEGRKPRSSFQFMFRSFELRSSHSCIFFVLFSYPS